MRTFAYALVLAAAACGNNPSPRLITGGGIGDGSIDGVANVYVIDAVTYMPLANATVEIGSTDLTTDATGLAVFDSLSGPQTVVVQAAGYRGEVWQDANGANMTVPMSQLGSLSPQQATLTGMITGYDSVTVPAGHLKAAIVSYSSSNGIDDTENNITTPNSGNVCITADACNWTVASRTGAVTLTAAIVDRDPNGTPADPSDDLTTIIGYATSGSIQVAPGVSQSGIALALVDAGNLQDVTLAEGTPPAALTTLEPIVGIELSADEVAQLPTFAQTDQSSILVPLPSAYVAGATYRLTVLAETASADQGAESATIQRGMTDVALAAGQWLEPPTGFTASRTEAALDPVDGATLHSVEWSDATGVLLDITMFDASNTAATVPALVALPATGTLTAKAQAIGADLDLQNFSLDADKNQIWGESSQPATID